MLDRVLRGVIDFEDMMKAAPLDVEVDTTYARPLTCKLKRNIR